MAVYRGTIELQSRDHMPCFHNVTEGVKKIVAESGIKNGICVVYSHHTTCSVMTQECSHDLNYFGREYLQMDLVEIMEKLIPTCRTEGQYHHPGPKHIEFALT
nr:YjbQ family protein [Clostridia bacterium]